MTYHEAVNGDALFQSAKVHPGGDITDYSEEAIPERDPAYRLPDGTFDQTRTMEYVTAAERLALIRQLEELGIRPATAAMAASL